MKVQHGDIAFDAPEGWDGMAVFVFRKPGAKLAGVPMLGVEDLPSECNIVVEIRPSTGASAASELKEMLNQLEEHAPGFVILEQDELLGGDLPFAVFTTQGASGMLVQMTLIARCGANVAVITGTTPSKQFATYRPLFEKTASSLSSVP